MANLTGEQGAVYFGTDSAGETSVASVRSWTLDHTKDTVENTSFSSGGARTYLNGLHQFSGSLECVFDTTEFSSHRNLFDPSYDSDVFIELWTSTDSGNEKYTGKVLITSVSRTASYDDLITVTVAFQGTGALGHEVTA